MHADVLRRAGIDYDRGVKRFVGRTQLYEKALMKFPRDGAFSRTRAAYEAGDMDGLLAGAHELKGVCGNIALTPLYEASGALVDLLRAGDVQKTLLDAAYARLEKAYHIINEAICSAMEGAE